MSQVNFRRNTLIIIIVSMSFLILDSYSLKEVLANGAPVNSSAPTFSPPADTQSFGSNTTSFNTPQVTGTPQQQRTPAPLQQQELTPPSTKSFGSNTTSFNTPQVSGSPLQQTAPAPLQQQGPPSTFAAKGTINSLIFVPQTKWIATGNWSMDVNNGNLKDFATNMSWFDEKGTATHTHEFQNFRSNAEFMVISQGPDNKLALQGLMDVGTNSKIVWRDVPTTIDIKGGKTIAISVDDSSTNKHFAAQPILGIVNSLTSGLDVAVVPAKDSVNSGGQQTINVTVSDSTSDKKIDGARITGVIIDASPGADSFIEDMNSTEPITTSEIDGQKFSGTTDSNGQFSTTKRISDSLRTGTFTIVVTVRADDYDPISKIVPFQVEESD